MRLFKEFIRISNLLQTARIAFSNYTKEIVAIIGMGFLSGILEGIGINAIIPLFSFVTGSSDMPTDIISRFIEKLFLFFNIPYRIEFLLIFILILFIVKAAVLLYSKYMVAKIHSLYIYDTRLRLYKETLQSNWSFLSKQKIGYLEKVLVNDITQGASLLVHISAAVILATNALVYIIIAFNISITITLLTLVVGAVVFLLLKPLLYKTKNLSQKITIALKETAHHINESIIGIKVIKAEHSEKSTLKRAKEHFKHLRDTVIRLAFIENLINVSIQPVSAAFILAIFAVSYKLPSFNFASFIVVVYAINKIFAQLQSGQSKLNQAVANYPFLKSALNHEREIQQHKEILRGKEKFIFKKTIQFSHTSFSYNDTQQTLSNINIAIPKGSIIGITGPSGSGKTTLADLLLRLIQPLAGSITIDGKPISNIRLPEWRSRVGYVSQDVFLLNDTIRNNISLYDSSISDDNIFEAMKKAYIYDFVKTLPNGLDTYVGERGTELSGGQRQRIALARTLVRNPEILILDEATSALDNESQSHIQETIHALRGKVTIIIIAHRPSTIAEADTILVLHDGTIVEQGSPQQLLKDNHSYYHAITHTYL